MCPELEKLNLAAVHKKKKRERLRIRCKCV